MNENTERRAWRQSAVSPNQRNASVGKAAAILRAAADHPEGLSVSGVARATGIPRATALRMVDALEAEGLLARRRDRDVVVLGTALLTLAAAVRPEQLLVDRARGPLTDLVRDLGESATLNVRHGDVVTCVLEVAGPRLIGPSGWLGQSWSLHATASGRLALAALADEALDRWLAVPAAPLTAATITDPEAIRDAVEDARRRGWAVSIDELEVGLTSVAAPVPGADAYVGISGPTARLDATAIAVIGTRLVATAAVIAR